MPEWINAVDATDALKREWNRRNIRSTYVVEDPAHTAATCYLLLSQPLSDEQRATFKNLLLDPQMPDAQSLAILKQLRAALVDVEVTGGMTLPAELATLEGQLTIQTGTATIGANARVTGAGTFQISSDASISAMAGTLDADLLHLSTTLLATPPLPPGQYDSAETRVYSAAAGGQGLRFQAGEYTFTGALTIYTSAVDKVCTIDAATNNPNITLQGNVSQSGSGTHTWDAGTGTVTFSGSADQSMDLSGVGEIEDVTVNKSSGRVTLAGNLACESFNGVDGDFDLAGFTITSAGSVDIGGDTGFRFHNGVDASMSDGLIDVDGGSLSLAGQEGSLLEINDLDFDLAADVSGTATYCDVTDSVCTYVDSEIDAADRTCVDNGGNEGWLFARQLPGIEYQAEDVRLHYQADDLRLHYEAVDDRLHYMAGER